MAVSRAKKIEQVEKLGQELKKVSSLVIATYSKPHSGAGFRIAQDLAHLRSEVPGSKEHAGAACR